MIDLAELRATCRNWQLLSEVILLDMAPLLPSSASFAKTLSSGFYLMIWRTVDCFKAGTGLKAGLPHNMTHYKEGNNEKNKYNKWLGDDDYDARLVKPPPTDYAYLRHSQGRDDIKIPAGMLLTIRGSPGFFLGLPSGLGGSNYIGIPQGTEGNTVVVGGNGSGKSAGIAKPTLRTWRGAICATDIKGELSEFYVELYNCGLAARPYIIFDPMQIDGPSYDPFWLPAHDSTDNLFNNVKEIAIAIAPVQPDDKQPFWAETEQGVLTAALLHYFKCGLSFSEAMCKIVSSTMSKLCEELLESQDIHVRMALGEIGSLKPETRACFDQGLRNKLMVFAADPYINHAFRGQREGANCFTWDDLDHCNIFLRIPADKIEQWSGAINLMYTQLIRHLERRPEMYSVEGAHNVQTLLLMDEFARFGKLEVITSAISTLRSKNVNVCLMIQSIAQLDRIYGEHDRRIIFDNCQFKAILRANDAETQRYLSELIGTRMCAQRSVSEHMDEESDTTGYSRQISETRDWTVQPHELATLRDALLLTPYGFFQATKFQLCDEEMKAMLFSVPNVTRIQCTAVVSPKNKNIAPTPGVSVRVIEKKPDISKKNEGARKMSIEERIQNANKRIDAAERKRRQEERATQEVQKRKDSRRNNFIGEMVTRYFPSLREYDTGTDTENRTRFESLEAFLYVLSTDYELVEELQNRAAQMIEEDPDGGWRLSM